MSSSFSFKLDPNSLPKLSARGDNYTEWRSAWTVALRYAGLWPIVSGKKTKPAATVGPGAEAREELIDKWDADDNKAMVMLLSSVHNDLTMSIASCDTSPEAWKHLSSRFDRDTGNASITLFRSLTNLRYADGDDLRLHLDEFHQRWTRMAKRCAGSSQSVAKAMKAMFESDEVKGSFFLATLPDTMDHVIDNLSSRDVTKFVDIEPKILDISDKHSLDADSSTAYAAKQTAARGARQNQGGARGPRPPTTTTIASECSWCRKHNLTFIGHVYTNCNELKKHKEQQQRNGAPKDKRPGAKRQKANNATAAESSDDEDDDDSATEVVGFTAQYRATNAAAGATIDLTGSPPQSTRTTLINANGKRSRETVSAHAAIRRPSAIDPPTVWLLDTGASRHMTGCADDFVSLSPKQGTITVAGGIKLPIDGVGLVRLRCRMPDRSTKIVELTNVLYSSELYGTRLFSWSYVRHHHNLELHGKANNIYLTRNGATVLWARHADGVIQIQTETKPTAHTASIKCHAPTDLVLAHTLSQDPSHTPAATVSAPSWPTLAQETACFSSYTEFHHSIGHLNIPNPARIYNDGHLVPAKPHDFHCDMCSLSKSKRQRPAPSSPVLARTIKPFEVIHSDLSGKFPRPSLGGARYFMSFICQATRYSWIKMLKLKSDAPNAIRDFIAFANTQYNAQMSTANIHIHSSAVKRFKSDNGGEYRAATQDLRRMGIQHDMVPPYHHELNGVAERWNQSIIQVARSMIPSDSQLFLWGEAVQTANFLKNISPHAADKLGRTPHELLNGAKPSVKHLHPFGSKIFAHIPVEARQPGSKLLHRAEQGIFVGYGRNTKTARVYIPSRHVIMETRNVHFEPFSKSQAAPFFRPVAENEIPAAEPVSPSLRQPQIKDRRLSGDTFATPPTSPTRSTMTAYTPSRLEAGVPLDHSYNQSAPAPVQLSAGNGQHTRSAPPTSAPGAGARGTRRVTRPTQDLSDPVELRRSKRVAKPSRKAADNAEASLALEDMLAPDDEDMAHAVACVSKADIDHEIPRTFNEAVNATNSPLWIAPINKEVQAHLDNGTWVIEHNPPPNLKLVGTRWVFDIKRDEHGKVVKRKARLVAQGFSQRPGVDFDDTYSPVVRYDSLRLIIAVALWRQWIMHQVDFDAAYLNGRLQHAIYAKVPPGVPSDGATVIRIVRALYGLKQSGREWYALLSQWLISQGFTQASFDPCVFISDDLILGIYVDDVLMAGTPKAISAMLDATRARFKFRDMGRPRLLLGLEIDHHADHVKLHQRTYIAAILRRYGMDNCNGRHTPLDPNSFPPRSTDPVDLERQKLYQSIIGSINFLAIVSRPDLSYTVSMLGSYNSNPSDLHLKMAYQTLRYIQATRTVELDVRSPAPSDRSAARTASIPTIVMFSDASFGSDPDNSKSFSGYLMKVGGSTVSWSSKRQSCVARSTCEAEYMAASHAASHLVWSRQAIKELMGHAKYPSCWLMVDNEPALSLIKDHRISNRSKHINVHYHFVRERFVLGDYTIEHVRSADNLADIGTKSLPRPLLDDLRSRICATTAP
ncbi:hypothetical protein HBH51_231200 [Parastagonospora nodorum]|nr:hypothetical protein HBH51_231200 [Parastagonospora nodorum]